MEFEGVTPACGECWERGATALVGISPFNSYFSVERIRAILEFCALGGREVVLFVPDDVTRFTLQAKGYSPERAIHKTRRQVQYLHNKIRRASQGREVEVIGCEALASNPVYMKHRALLNEAFRTEAGFRCGCLETTRWVLGAREQEIVTEEASALGVRYLLEELPLFMHAPEILGRPSVVFVYHQCPDFIASLYRDESPMKVSEGQGFGIVRDSDAATRSAAQQQDRQNSIA